MAKPKPKTRGAQKQKLIGKQAVTRDYQPIMIHHWGVRPRDLPIFTFLSVQAMLYDPTIRLGLAMRAAPVYQTKFGWKEQDQWQEGVYAKNEAVGAFVYRQLQRIWQHDVPSLVKSQLWGHAGGEVMLKLSEDNLVEVDRLLERHPNDIRALKRGGQNVGIRVSRLTKMNQGGVDLEWPKAYWTSFGAEAGSFYGTSILIGAYSPWYDKWCDGGALDVRRLYMHKDAYVGASIYYPEGDLYTMPDGQEVPARDLARQMIEQIVAGGVVALPSDVDEKGNRKWELKPATVASNPAHILRYPQDLDTEMLRGIEVPDDIFTADSQSSGAWAGKKVPLSAFYAGIDCWIVQLIKDLTRCIFEPLVLLNFGKAEEFQICHKPLAEQAMEQQNQPQGPQQPGGPGGEPGAGGAGGGMPGGLGGPGGADDSGGGGGGGLAELLSSPAAQQARQGGGGQQAMSLEAAIGRGVIDAAKIVQASRETLDAALQRMASDANPWVEYHGPRGGHGWRHAGTGDVRYGGDRPGAHETGGEENVQSSEPYSAAKQSPVFSRHELPQISGADKPEFYQHLQAQGIGVELKSVPVGSLKGIQRDLNTEKVGQMAAAIREKGSLGKSPLMASNDGYIVDGHHRWAAEQSVDPSRKVAIAQVDLPVHELIAKIANFPKSFKVGTDESAAARSDRTYPSEPAEESSKQQSTNENLAVAFQGGDRKAGDALLAQNGGLTYGFARKFAKRPDDIDDLNQEAKIALLSAAKSFDPARGFRFSTLATRSILNRLSSLTARAGKRRAVWNQTPEDNEGQAIEPSVQPDVLPTEHGEQVAAVRKAVEALPERAKTIVQRAYGLDGDPPETAVEISKKVGLTHQRVSQILHRATAKLRPDLQEWVTRLAAEANPWIAYKGPRGGAGWRHGGTGDIRYQADRPGANETGSGGSKGSPSSPSKSSGGGLFSGFRKLIAAVGASKTTAKTPPAAELSDDEKAADWKANGTKGAAFKSWFGDWERDAANSSKVVNRKGEPQETHGIPGTGSVVKDSSGRPVVVYHGTSSGGFDEFDPAKLDQNALFGAGFYFTEDHEIAASYTKKRTAEQSTPDAALFNAAFGDRSSPPADKPPESPATAEVKSLYLNIRKPLDMDRDYEFRSLPASVQKTLQKRSRVPYKKTSVLSGHKVWRKIGDDPQDCTEQLQKHGYDGITHIGGDRMGQGHHHRVWIAFQPEQIKATDNQGTFSTATRNIRMAGDVNPWVPHRGARGGQGWKRSDTGEIRYQKDRPGAHEGGAGQPQPATEARPMSPEEFSGALNNLIDNPEQNGLSPTEASQLKRAVAKVTGSQDAAAAWHGMDASEKVKLLDDLTEHKFDKGRTGGAPAATPKPAKPAAAPPASPTPPESPPVKQPTAQSPEAQRYVDAAQRNLQKISRTAQGVVDTSASKEKAGKMQVGSGAEAAKLATENFSRVTSKLHSMRSMKFESPKHVLDFMDSVNKGINQGITKSDVLLRTDDSPKYPYTEVSKLPKAREQFASEFMQRLDKSDPREMAAWVHWRLNMTDHPYADGVGKTSEALANWVLMRAGEDLPKIDNRANWFANANKQRVDPDRGGSGYYHEGYKQFADYYGGLFAKPRKIKTPSGVDRNNVAYGARGGWPWSKPANSHWGIMGDYPQVDPHGEDTQQQHKTPDAEGNYDNGQYTPQRQKLHNEIIDKHFAGKQPVAANEQPTYLFLGGGTAAGKSTVLRTGRVAVPPGAVHVDSDEIKNDLPEFQRHAEDRNVAAAGIVHEESSDISKTINTKSLQGRYNVVMDGTGDTSLESVAKKVGKARKAGHKIVAHYMTNDIEKAVSNAQKRAGEPPYRMVGMAPTLKIHAGVSQVFPQAVAAGLFDEVSLWDTNGDKPVLVASGKGKELMVHDQAAYDKFLAKANLMETHKHLLTDEEKTSDQKVEKARQQPAGRKPQPAIAMALDDGPGRPGQQTMSMEDVFRITKEVAIGAKPKTPDTPEQAQFRASVQRDAAEAKASGKILHVPTDWAD